LIHSEPSTDISLENQVHKLPGYELDNQIGYLLRLANQRHLEIFSEYMPLLTPTQFSVMARLYEVGELSQNELGRRVGIDAATTKGVIERLLRKDFIESKADSKDRRRLRISLTTKGLDMIVESIPKAQSITQATVANLTMPETKRLLALLKKLKKT
jgi:MarR family transcriptional regulator, lower aerobic nicotinate degradation pathway regulator